MRRGYGKSPLVVGLSYRTCRCVRRTLHAGAGDAGGHIRGGSVGFWVPADSASPGPNAQVDEKAALKQKLREEEEEDDTLTLTLMQILTEYMSLGLLIRSKMAEPMPGEGPGEEREWVSQRKSIYIVEKCLTGVGG